MSTVRFSSFQIRSFKALTFMLDANSFSVSVPNAILILFICINTLAASIFS